MEQELSITNKKLLEKAHRITCPFCKDGDHELCPSNHKYPVFRTGDHEFNQLVKSIRGTDLLVCVCGLDGHKGAE